MEISKITVELKFNTIEEACEVVDRIKAGGRMETPEPEVKVDAETAPEAPAAPAPEKVKRTRTPKVQPAPASEPAPAPAPAETPAPAEPAPAPAPTAQGITTDMLRIKVAEKINEHRDAIKAKLTELGAQKVTLLEGEQREEMYRFLETL